MQGLQTRPAFNMRASGRLLWGTPATAEAVEASACDGELTVARSLQLQDRLEEIMVMELLKDGETKMLSLSVRSLYRHVLAAITKRPEMNATATNPTSITATDIQGDQVTYRERLGGYLHPRDMRRLVTPFSASNEPDLIVRRHAILLNFDPLRAIIVRDRLLVIIPKGADGLVSSLEQRVRGGSKEWEAAIFGSSIHHSDNLTDSQHAKKEHYADTSHYARTESDEKHQKGGIFAQIQRVFQGERSSGSSDSMPRDDSGNKGRYLRRSKSDDFLDRKSDATTTTKNVKKPQKPPKTKKDDPTAFARNSALPSNKKNKKMIVPDQHPPDKHQEEWNDLQGKDWIRLPFELQCADSVLETVVELLAEDTDELQQVAMGYIEELFGGKQSASSLTLRGEDPLTVIRSLKDSIREMAARVKGFVKSMNDILDDYEGMALMNLSRLMTHPERFIQPVPAEVLEEESDEPELILESYLQHGLSLLNVLDLVQGQIDTAAEFVDQKLDSTQNKILLVNTIVTVVALCVQLATLVAGYFGMNLVNHLEDDENAFAQVTYGSLAGMVILFVALMIFLVCTGTLPRWTSVANGL